MKTAISAIGVTRNKRRRIRLMLALYKRKLYLT
jgi:hypothetical protein